MLLLFLCACSGHDYNLFFNRREMFCGDLKFIEEDLGLDFETLKRVAGWATMNDLENPAICEHTKLTRAQVMKRYFLQ